jgi:hypothetical protein
VVEAAEVWNTSRKEEEATMRMSRFLTLVLVAAVATPVLAGPLAPTKASDIAILMPDVADGSNGACGLKELRVDGIISGADGSVSPFTIPAKEVLVLTGGTWSDTSLGGNVNAFLELRLETASTNNNIVATTAVRTDAAGAAARAFTLEPGIVIKPGASLCATLNVAGINTVAFPRLTGFLAKDK